MSADERQVHEHLLASDRDHVRTLRIDREDKLGALSSGLVAALGEQVDDFARSDARVLVLTGTGRGFIAGADVTEYHGVDTQTFVAYQHRSRAVFDALATVPKPTIAAVNGYAFGGGFEVALCCDIVLASDDATFALPEVKLGLVPGGGGTQRLARQAGPRFAAEVAMTGRAVTAAEAERRGIVREVVPGAELVGRALEVAGVLARRAPVALAALKRLTAAADDLALPDGLTAEQATLAAVFETADAREGIEAFVAKRRPTFQGK